MTNPIKTTALIALGFAGLTLGASLPAAAAPATESFEVDFLFVRSAPVEVTYENFEDIARRACRSQMSPVTLTETFTKVTRECESELMEKAVLETEMADLAAYHAEQTKR